jgi:hypothetical protein
LLKFIALELGKEKKDGFLYMDNTGKRAGGWFCVGKLPFAF